MRTLALDTSTPAGSVAWRRDGRTIASREGDPSRPHATRLPGALIDLLSEDGATLDDVELLAVGLGPGAFTGLRVGLATMQGLAFATGRPIVGVSGLDALAVAARRTADVVLGVWIDAARQEVFAARYVADTGAPLGVATLESPVAAKPLSVLEEWRRSRPDRMPMVWIGGGASTYRDAIRDYLGEPGSIVDAPLLAPVIAELAERLASTGAATTPHALRPLYIRRPDAELARGRSVPVEGGQ